MIYKGKKGGYVKVSSLADPSDYTQNLEAAKILANNGYRVMINRHYKKSDPEYGKNAEYTINGIRSDLKTPSKLISIGTGFSNAQKQKLTEFVSRLMLDFTYQNIIDGIDKGFTYNDSIMKVIFIKGKKAVEISRNQWVDNSYLELIKEL